MPQTAGMRASYRKWCKRVMRKLGLDLVSLKITSLHMGLQPGNDQYLVSIVMQGRVLEKDWSTDDS